MVLDEMKKEVSQPEFTCSKLAIETLEQGVNMFKVNNKDTRMEPPKSPYTLQKSGSMCRKFH